MFAISLPSFNFLPLSGLIGGIVALIFGILILIFPRILNYLALPSSYSVYWVFWAAAG
jgi:hypothetical protein